jgi:hypothetical protein
MKRVRNVSDELTPPWNAKAAKAAKKRCSFFAYGCFSPAKPAY